MGVLTALACRAEICGSIYENYGEITVTYSLPPQNGEETQLLLPYLPSGTICDMKVYCDEEEIASAVPVNIREVEDFSADARISLTSRTAGLLVLGIKGICARKSLEISVTVCISLIRHGNHTALSFISPDSQGDACSVVTDISILGDVKRVVSPTTKIEVAMAEDLCRVFSKSSDCGAVIFDIFYKSSAPNRIIISRQPLQKNIALCCFTPKLRRIKDEKRTFDVNISFKSANRAEIISLAAAFFDCLKKEDTFRLTLGNELLMDFADANSDNIENALNLICKSSEKSPLSPKSGDYHSVLICSGTIFDGDIALSGTPFIIFSGSIPKGLDENSYTYATKESAEIIIPARFSQLYEKRLHSARLVPVGGIGVELLCPRPKFLTANTVHYAFARHEVIPPKGFNIYNENRRIQEEIYFDKINTYAKLRTVDIIYAKELINIKEQAAESAPCEEYCLYREEINNICIDNKIASGDIALIAYINGKSAGYLSPKPSLEDIYGKYFGEKTSVDPNQVVGLILKAQTTDGIIADITVSRPDQTVFSTAVCLIALYLYEKDKYRAFAKRSLDFLKNKEGFWAKTALDLWGGEEIDYAELDKRLEMKIMYEQLFELAILIIKSYRRKRK